MISLPIEKSLVLQAREFIAAFIRSYSDPGVARLRTR